MKHNGDFSYDLLLGQMGEGLLADILKLNGDKVEVKTDYKATRTGNLFIEYEKWVIYIKGRLLGVYH
jgi:hypothetical protein